MKPYAKELMAKNPVFRDVAALRQTVWINDRYLPFDMVDAVCQLVVSDADIRDAADRFRRFAPYIRKCFPETAATNGLIQSPLTEIEAMRRGLESACGTSIPGRLFLKRDSELAIAGSVKARGGIYEVLKHAEDIALAAGLVRPGDSYERFADAACRELFSRHTIQVGSTGNLGLSIGIMSAHLGFNVKVHMSADAKGWKKELLREHGAEVIEYDDDYHRAVAEGRRMSELDPASYFVDDEFSRPLFLGYAAAAGELRSQLDAAGVTVDDDHPLIVYIPAGVGSAPGGICYGLKRLYRDNVHVFFAEPTRFPSVLLGFASDRYDAVNVSDFDISGMSAADGLACASPSGLVTRLDRNLVSGFFTVSDGMLFDYMRLLADAEGIRIEPSSCAAFIGPTSLTRTQSGRDYLTAQGLTDERLANAAHICWATGGSLVPETEWERYMTVRMAD